MFNNINGARLSAKRVQSTLGIKSSVSKEVVARVGGWPDWHSLEQTIGNENAPRNAIHSSLDDYISSHQVAADVPTLLRLATPEHKSKEDDGEKPRLKLTEGAIRILTALHCGCDAHIWNSKTRGRYSEIKTHSVAPYTSQKPIHHNWKSIQEPGDLIYQDETRIKRIDDVFEQIAVQAYGDTSPPKPMGVYDRTKAQRLDNWSGEDREESYRDGLMLVRGGLVTYIMANLRITDEGRAIAQAIVGAGRIIEGVQAKVISVEPNRNYVVSDPDGLQMMDTVPAEQEIKFKPWGEKIFIEARCDLGDIEVGIKPAIAKTLAAFLADAGKVERPTTARFGDVEVTLEPEGAAATLRFSDDDNDVTAHLPRALARLTRTYLAELAKGGDQEAVLSPVDVTWKATFASRPESLA